jgi:hypothetical protein
VISEKCFQLKNSVVSYNETEARASSSADSRLVSSARSEIKDDESEEEVNDIVRTHFPNARGATLGKAIVKRPINLQ